MTFRKFFIWTLPVLVVGMAAVGWVGAQEVGPATQTPEASVPEPAAAMPVSVTEPASVPEQAAVEQEPVVEEPEGVVQQDGAAEEDALVLLPPVPPRSLQTMVDERRDMLRERRNAMFDAFSGRPAYMSPWMASYDEAVERYRDAMRAMYRQQRDYNMLRHDSWMDAMCPWSKPQRDWSRQRSILMQLEQLERQEARDAWLYGQPFAFTGSAPW